MKQNPTVEWLAKAVQQAAKSAYFCVDGSLGDSDPGLVIEGLGPVKFPLPIAMDKRLIACCRVAPYGKGTKTLVDRRVRNTYELDPSRFRLSNAWNEAITAATKSVAQKLGLPASRLEPRLYKLLVYAEGGFFLRHRDSEKHDGMVASLIVVLPNHFAGGALIVRHGQEVETINFAEAANEYSACYAAFYADCEHEVERVTAGVRVCLAYNLVLKNERCGADRPEGAPAAASPLAGALAAWTSRHPGKPLAFALEHHYTQRGLSVDLLKGSDRQLAARVMSAAEAAGCLVHLAQVTRHCCLDASAGSYGTRHGRAPGGRRVIQTGEVFLDELVAREWNDAAGHRQPWGEISLELNDIVTATPIEEWQPTSEEYEGYTGNAGNTLDRWYHRSVLVVWHRDKHFEMIARMGVEQSVSTLSSMVSALAKTAKRRQEEARSDCIRLAQAIIALWPRRSFMGYDSWAAKEALHKTFPPLLLRLGDRETVAQFLGTVARVDRVLPLKSFIVAGCRQFGWNAFAAELRGLLTAPASHQQEDSLAPRDIEWLAAFCRQRPAEANSAALARELCGLAVQQLFKAKVKPWPDEEEHFRLRPAIAAESLQPLLQALAASGSEQDLSRVLRLLEESPELYSPGEYQAPALLALIPWSQKHLGRVPPGFITWLETVRARLQAAVARPPQAPRDWTRPDDVKCKCEYCAKLKRFLADANLSETRIRASALMRDHLIGTIARHACDVKYSLLRQGNPHALVLKKTERSYERAVNRYQKDQKLLAALANIDLTDR